MKRLAAGFGFGLALFVAAGAADAVVADPPAAPGSPPPSPSAAGKPPPAPAVGDPPPPYDQRPATSTPAHPPPQAVPPVVAPPPAAQAADRERPTSRLAGDAVARGHVDLREEIPSASPRSAGIFAVAFVSGLVASVAIPLPLPHAGVALGVNLGPWLMLEGIAGIPYALGGGRVFFARGEIAPYVAGRAGESPGGLMIVPGIGVDVSRGDGTYAFTEAGLIWDRSSVTVYPPASPGIPTTTTTTTKWAFAAGHLTFGIGKRF